MGSRYDRRSISPDNLSFASQALLALRPGLGSSFASWNARRLGAFARKTEHLPVPVVSVGNIAFGGTGKTPVTLSLARWLTERGRRVGVVASGHIGRLRKEGALVSDGGHVFLDVPQVGEEAVLLARALRELRIPVAAGAPRGDLARQLIDRHGVDYILLDDGFQYRSLARDIDLCLVDATNPFGAGGTRDTGYLRESPTALARASAILLTKTNLLPFLERPVVGPQPSENRPRMLPATRDWILGSLAEYAAGVPVIEVPATGLHLELVWDPPPETPERGTAEPLEAAEAESEPPAPEPGGSPMRLLPVSAIGNAEGYEATCRMAGLRFRDPVRYDDHTVFSQGDVLWWTQLARQWDYPGIVVTSKDWVKIHPLRGGLRVRCYVLTMRLEPPDWGQVIRMEAGDGRGAAQ